MNVPTPHNQAVKGDIAKTVIMPGDPLRAQFIAENFLTDVVCYNKIRSMYGFTGIYKGHRISVQGSGMGVPSMGIYSKELFEGYDVDNIIRVGSAGALSDNVKLKDIVVSEYVQSDSNYLKLLDPCGNIKLTVSNNLLCDVLEISKKEDISIKVGKTFTSIVFYSGIDVLKSLAENGMLCIEMETLALYANAAIAKKKALAMFTISDNPITGESLPAEEREKGFTDMMKLALELAVKCTNP